MATKKATKLPFAPISPKIKIYYCEMIYTDPITRGPVESMTPSKTKSFVNQMVLDAAENSEEEPETIWGELMSATEQEPFVYCGFYHWLAY